MAGGQVHGDAAPAERKVENRGHEANADSSGADLLSALLAGKPLERPIVGLAPMAGVTDMPARLLAMEAGADFAVSEMLSAKGFLYQKTLSRATEELLLRDSSETRLGVQLFGREPELIARAAERMPEYGYRFVDLNFGCPAPKIVKNGEGSALLREPKLVEAIVREAVRHSALPVTAKFRIGIDGIGDPVETAKICEGGGARVVCLHARTREQFYAGSADWSQIERVVRAVSIPVLGNGDVTGGDAALRMIRETGCAGVLVGRASEGNPWVFSEIRAKFENRPYQPPSANDRAAMALRHARMQADMLGESHGIVEMRKHVAWYMQGTPGCAALRARLSEISSISDLIRILSEYTQRAE